MNRRTFLIAPVALALPTYEPAKKNRFVMHLTGIDDDGNSIGALMYDVRKVEELMARFPEFTFVVHTRLLEP